MSEETPQGAPAPEAVAPPAPPQQPPAEGAPAPEAPDASKAAPSPAVTLPQLNATLERFGKQAAKIADANYALAELAAQFVEEFLGAAPGKAQRSTAVDRLAAEWLRWDEESLTRPLAQAMTRLRERVNMLLRVNAVVDLIGDGAGVPKGNATRSGKGKGAKDSRLPWGTLRELAPLVRRVNSDDEFADRWEILPAVVEQAKAFVADVATSGLTRPDAVTHVARLLVVQAEAETAEKAARAQRAAEALDMACAELTAAEASHPGSPNSAAKAAVDSAATAADKAGVDRASCLKALERLKAKAEAKAGAAEAKASAKSKPGPKAPAQSAPPPAPKSPVANASPPAPPKAPTLATSNPPAPGAGKPPAPTGPAPKTVEPVKVENYLVSLASAAGLAPRDTGEELGAVALRSEKGAAVVRALAKALFAHGAKADAMLFALVGADPGALSAKGKRALAAALAVLNEEEAPPAPSPVEAAHVLAARDAAAAPTPEPVAA